MFKNNVFLELRTVIHFFLKVFDPWKLNIEKNILSHAFCHEKYHFLMPVCTCSFTVIDLAWSLIRLKYKLVHLVSHATYTIFKTNEIVQQTEKSWPLKQYSMAFYFFQLTFQTVCQSKRMILFVNNNLTSIINKQCTFYYSTKYRYDDHPRHNI